MKKIYGYVTDFFIKVDKRILFLSMLFIAVFIYLNYHFNINRKIFLLGDAWEYLCWYFVFLVAFSFPYYLLQQFRKKQVFQNKSFVVLLLLAPAIFSVKMVVGVNYHFSRNSIINNYWNNVFYYPTKLLGVSFLLFIIWLMRKEKQPFYGMKTKNFHYRPYFIMLLFIIPLIGAASAQPDFLLVYPKFQHITFLKEAHSNGLYKILYELSYGMDFFTIELFFRGFLILAFVKWFGKDCILPMACFYCTIHFGKPLAECISSFFGGTILGIVIYHTRTIYGGLIVHLGTAWMMELGGYLGSYYCN